MTPRRSTRPTLSNKGKIQHRASIAHPIAIVGPVTPLPSPLSYRILSTTKVHTRHTVHLYRPVSVVSILSGPLIPRNVRQAIPSTTSESLPLHGSPSRKGPVAPLVIKNEHRYYGDHDGEPASPRLVSAPKKKARKSEPMDRIISIPSIALSISVLVLRPTSAPPPPSAPPQGRWVRSWE
jgi:hypothetical protein